MSSLAEYFAEHRYHHKYQIGDRIGGRWNKIPFVGSVGNDRLVNPEIGPEITVHLDLPISWQGKIYRVIVVKHADVKPRRQLDY